jgi:hypothetical protein
MCARVVSCVLFIDLSFSIPRQALNKMVKALRETVILGLTTNKAFLQQVLLHPHFRSGHFNTHFIDHHLPADVRYHHRATRRDATRHTVFADICAQETVSRGRQGRNGDRRALVGLAKAGKSAEPPSPPALRLAQQPLRQLGTALCVCRACVVCRLTHILSNATVQRQEFVVGGGDKAPNVVVGYRYEAKRGTGTQRDPNAHFYVKINSTREYSRVVLHQHHMPASPQGEGVDDATLDVSLDGLRRRYIVNAAGDRIFVHSAAFGESVLTLKSRYAQAFVGDAAGEGEYIAQMPGTLATQLTRRAHAWLIINEWCWDARQLGRQDTAAARGRREGSGGGRGAAGHGIDEDGEQDLRAQGNPLRQRVADGDDPPHTSSLPGRRAR